MPLAPLHFLGSHVCYWLGNTASLLCDAIAADWPRHPEWLIDAVYRCYSRFMAWSCTFDKNDWIWLTRREGETEEEFDRRADERWPDR